MVPSRAVAAVALGVAVVGTCAALLALAGQERRGTRGVQDRRLFTGFGGATLPSTYLNYVDPTEGVVTSWFTTFDPSSSGEDTFFAVQRTGYGYLGIQQVPTKAFDFFKKLKISLSNSFMQAFEGLVIFSIWNNGDNTCRVVSVGDGAYQDTFSGEGTGCQIKLNTVWTTTTYSFMTTVEASSTTEVTLSGYWYNPFQKDDWRLVGSIAIAAEAAEGDDFGLNGIASFIEQFRAVGTKENREASYGPQFLSVESGSWVPIDEAQFATTDSDNQNAVTEAEVNAAGTQFQMGVAGVGSQASTPEGTDLTLRNPGDPSASVELQAFIRLDSANQLPTGCTGVKSCNIGTFDGFSRGFNQLFPGSPLDDVVRLLLLGFGGFAIFMAIKQCVSSSPGYAPLDATGASDRRVLQRQFVE